MKYDAIVIGGGHNGLVTACYLARAKWRVLVLERRYVVGGACVTEETFPRLQSLDRGLRQQPLSARDHARSAPARVTASKRSNAIRRRSRRSSTAAI